MISGARIFALPRGIALSAIIEKTTETYGIENWGAGYFGVNRKGNLIVRASEDATIAADVKEIVDDLRKRGISTPILLKIGRAHV